jgi:heme/copper-type cytochrome/quinol oxidase subunit 3
MSEVTRSMEATSAPAAAYVARRRQAMPSGWWGIALFIAVEATLFGTLIASYFYLRFRSTQWPPAGIEAPKVLLPLVLTGALVAASVPMFLAVRASRLGRARAACLLILLALAVQAAYFGIQVHLYLSDLDKFSPKGSAYGSIYFTLVGAHHAHVAAGMLLSLFVLARTITGITNYRMIAIRVVALYWYFVTAAAVFVVLTQLYPSL